MPIVNCSQAEFDRLVDYIKQFGAVQVTSTKYGAYRISPEGLCSLPAIDEELASMAPRFDGIVWYDFEMAGMKPREFELCYLALGELSAQNPGAWCVLYAWMAPISAWLLNNYGWEILGRDEHREVIS